MAAVIATATEVGFHLGQPWWLLACALTAPVVWQAWRGASAGHQRGRRIVSTILRVLVVGILAVIFLGGFGLTLGCGLDDGGGKLI